MRRLPSHDKLAQFSHGLTQIKFIIFEIVIFIGFLTVHQVRLRGDFFMASPFWYIFIGQSTSLGSPQFGRVTVWGTSWVLSHSPEAPNQRLHALHATGVSMAAIIHQENAGHHARLADEKGCHTPMPERERLKPDVEVPAQHDAVITCAAGRSSHSLFDFLRRCDLRGL